MNSKIQTYVLILKFCVKNTVLQINVLKNVKNTENLC